MNLAHTNHPINKTKTIIPPQYMPYIKMHKVGTPLGAIKIKLSQNKLDINTL